MKSVLTQGFDGPKAGRVCAWREELPLSLAVDNCVKNSANQRREGMVIKHETFTVATEDRLQFMDLTKRVRDLFQRYSPILPMPFLPPWFRHQRWQ